MSTVIRNTDTTSVAIGIGAEARPGEIVFGLHGRALLRLCPDGTIEVNGREACSDLELVDGLRAWLAQTIQHGCGRCGWRNDA